MSLVAVPGGDEFMIGWPVKGRRVLARGHVAPVAVAWVTDRACHQAGAAWACLSDEAARTGLQPILLSGLDGGTEDPWDNGGFSEPEDTDRIAAIDVAGLLGTWWDGRVPCDEEHEEDADLRAVLAPCRLRFPGLAAPIAQELDSELMQRALHQYTQDARIGVVPADRPADVLPRLGWMGACNHRDASEIAAVLRSWEDRYGARLLQVGRAAIRLLVSRPPRILEEAVPIAAEHYAFSDEFARRGPIGLGDIAHALVDNPFWDFWWD